MAFPKIFMVGGTKTCNFSAAASRGVDKDKEVKPWKSRRMDSGRGSAGPI